MKFFLPGVETPESAELIYDHLKEKSISIALRVTDKRIYRVLYKRNGRLFNMKVGSPDSIRGEMVIAIFDNGLICYLVFTLNRGVIKGNPYIVGKDETLTIEEFEI